MREIEFRGKLNDTNHYHYVGWCYGSLVYSSSEDQYYIIEHCGDELSYPVDKETIGQFTGVCDKNGTKIFEGDILEFCFDYIGNQKAIIIYNNNYTSFMLKPLANFCFTTMSDGVVVGNIHDNPELLEV